MATVLTNEFRLGIQSGKLCHPLSANPFVATSACWNAWRAGYAFKAALGEARGLSFTDVRRVTHGRGALINVECDGTGQRKGRARLVYSVDDSPLGATLFNVVTL
ncbi:MAG: hypothetical protein V4696_03905 [Pseudomonadota bacterium]